MLCPSCLTTNIRLQRVKAAGRLISIHTCSNYKEQKLALYVQDHCQYRPAVIRITGFRPHSKTVHFAPPFFTLKKFTLGRDRPDFLKINLNEDKHTVVYGPTHLQEGEALPGSTPKSFPRPPTPFRVPNRQLADRLWPLGFATSLICCGRLGRNPALAQNDFAVIGSRDETPTADARLPRTEHPGYD